MEQSAAFREDYQAMTPEELTDQMKRIEEALASHPASVAKARWDTLQRAYDVWARNMKELTGLLIVSETNDEIKLELIQNVRQDDGRRAFFALLDQRLFNMIASAIALVERTNGLKKDYADSAFADEFTRRSGAIALDPETKFLRRFRNYLLHVGAAPFATRAKVDETTNGEWDLKVFIDSATLLDRPEEWDSASRQFIAENPDGIHLRSVVERYGARMQDLFQWTFEQFEALHTEDVDSVNDLVRRANLTLTAGVSDGKDWHDRTRHIQENLDAEREGRPQTDYRTGLPFSDEGRSEEAERKG